MIFDDKFETVNSLPADQPLDKQWAQICQLGCECFLDIDYNDDDRPILPSLSEIIKQYNEAKEEQQKNAPTISVDFDPNDYLPPHPPPIKPVNLPTQESSPTLQAIQPQHQPTLPQNLVPGGDGGNGTLF